MIQFRRTGKARGDGDTLVPPAATLETAEGRGRVSKTGVGTENCLASQMRRKEGRKEQCNGAIYITEHLELGRSRPGSTSAKVLAKQSRIIVTARSTFANAANYVQGGFFSHVKVLVRVLF